MTKKGELMMFVNIADTYGEVEVIVFPSILNETKDVWIEDKMVIVNGSVSDKDGENKIICNEVKVLSKETIKDLKGTLKKLNTDVCVEAKNLYIFFKKVIDTKTIKELTGLFENFKGEHKVYLAVPIEDNRFRKIETNFAVNYNDLDLKSALEKVVDIRFVKVM